MLLLAVVAAAAVHSTPITIDDDGEAKDFSSGVQQRIRNGLRANQDQFRFQVSITSSSGNPGVLVCSGSSISSSWVLTAASCTIRHQRYDLRFSSITFYTGGFTMTSHVALTHPQFNPVTRQFDAALIQLPRAILSSDGIWTPINIPTTGQVSQNIDFANQISRVIGYGRIGNRQSPVLQFENIRIIRNVEPECQNALNANNITQVARVNFLCASRLQQFNQTNSCSGDIGSALFVTETNNRVVQVGIGTFDADHFGCIRSTTVFTRLIDVARWIRQIVPTA